ncbi:MAG: T9SS type A sorting domain-containing protein [Bacteroidota bacterium]
MMNKHFSHIHLRLSLSLLLSACLMGFSTGLQAQLSISWDQTLGGTNLDVGKALITYSDGSSVIVGETNSQDGDIQHPKGSRDVWVIRLNPQGQVIWNNNYGGSLDDVALDVVATPDKGLVFVGYSFSQDGDLTQNNGSADYWIARLDSSGQMLWQRSYGGSSSESAQSLISTADGGFLVVGYSYSNNGEVVGHLGSADCWVLKLNFLGQLQWQAIFGGTDEEWATDVIATQDGGYAFCGWTASSDGDITLAQGAQDAWVVKLDQTGHLQWQSSVGGTASDKASALVEDAQGNLFISGHTFSQDGDIENPKGASDFWMFSLADSGSLRWSRNYGGSGDDRATALIRQNDGTLVLAGRTFSSDGDVSRKEGFFDFWVMRTDDQGSLEWEHAFGGTEADYAHAIAPLPNDRLLVVGETFSDNGDISSPPAGSNDLWVAALQPWSTPIEPDLTPQMSLECYPNPTTDQVFLTLRTEQPSLGKLELLDLSGRTLWEWEVPPSTQPLHFSWSKEHLPAGQYFFRWTTPTGSITKKIMAIH